MMEYTVREGDKEEYTRVGEDITKYTEVRVMKTSLLRWGWTQTSAL